MPRQKKRLNFEQNLTDLETIVTQLEQGDLSLEESLVQFEKGIKLLAESQKTLSEAEQKVQLLLQQNGQIELVDFNDERDDDSEHDDE